MCWTKHPWRRDYDWKMGHCFFSTNIYFGTSTFLIIYIGECVQLVNRLFSKQCDQWGLWGELLLMLDVLGEHKSETQPWWKLWRHIWHDEKMTGETPDVRSDIYPKSEQFDGDILLSTDKLAEKVRKSGRPNFVTKVRYPWKCNVFGDKISYLVTQYDTCV